MKPEPILSAHFTPFELVAISLCTLAMTCLMPDRIIAVQAQERISDAAQPTFPALESAQWKDGIFPSIESVRQVKEGMDKDQVRNLLSSPHFSEGMAGVRDWNYIFHFRTSGSGVMTCQYMVRFSDRMLTTGSHWKTAECAALAEPPRAKIFVQAIEAIDPLPLPPQKLRLRVDDIFLSGEPNGAELRADGLRIVELVAKEILRTFGAALSVVVKVHTDRTRSQSAGDAMSLAQANAIRDALVRAGLDATAVRTVGAGKTEPLIDCPAGASPRETVACLRANRRVDIEVVGAQ